MLAARRCHGPREEVVREARTVREKMLHGHLRGRWTCDARGDEDFHVLEAGQVALDSVVEVQLRALNEDHGRHGNNRLRHRVYAD